MTKTLGQIAYEGYFEQCGGRSLVSGQSLPEWTCLGGDIRIAWEAAGVSVIGGMNEVPGLYALVDSRIRRGGCERGGALVTLYRDVRDACRAAIQRLIDDPDEQVMRRADGGISWTIGGADNCDRIVEFKPGDDPEFLAEFQMSVEATEYFHIYPVGVEDDDAPQPTEERDDD